MFKKIAGLGFAFVIFFSLCACDFGTSFNLQKRIAELENQIESQIDKAAEMDNQIGHQAERIAELENQIRQKSEEITKLEKQIEEQNKINAGLEEEIELLTEKITELDDENKTLKNRIAELEFEESLMNPTIIYLGEQGGFYGCYDGWLIFSYYYGEAKGTYRMRLDGSEREELLDSIGWGALIYADGWLYFYDGVVSTGGSNLSLYRMRIDGSEKTRLMTLIDSGSLVLDISDFVFEDEWIYYHTKNNLYRVKTNGTENKLFISNVSDFLIDADYIFVVRITYYDGWGPGSDTFRYNKDGTGKKLIYSSYSHVTPIFVDDGFLYFKYLSGLYRMKIDGTEIQKIIGGSIDIFSSFVLNDGFIYYSRNYTSSGEYMGEINKIKCDGTDNEVIVKEIPGFVYLYIVGNNILYTAAQDNSMAYYKFAGLWKVSINGGEPRIIYSYEGKTYGVFRGYSGFFIYNNKIHVVIQ